MKSSSLISALLAASIGLASFSAGAAPAAGRQIVIIDTTRHVNVTSGTTVHFVAGDRSFDWTFENVNGSVLPFDLQKVAPAGLLNHAVTVYVADSETYLGR